MKEVIFPQTFHSAAGELEAITLLKFVANRLNLEERDNPGGKYLLAAIRPDINKCLQDMGYAAEI